MNSDRRLENARSYASDVGVLGVLEALTRLRGLILLPIIARVLDTGAYGVWTQSLLLVMLGSWIVDLQLHTALVRFVSGTTDRDEQRAFFVPLLLAAFALSGLAVGATMAAPGLIAEVVLGDASYRDLAAWLGVWIALLTVSRMCLHMLRALQRVKLYGLLSTLQTFAQLVVVALVVITVRDLYLAVLAAIVVELAFALLVLTLALRLVGVGWPGLGKLRPALEFSLPLVPGFYAGAAMIYSDRIAIAAVLGAESVGVYAAAYSVARVVREIYKPIKTALLPAISRVWDRGDREQGRWLLSNTVRYYLILALPALVGVTALGPRILRLLAPEAVSGQATLIILLLAAGYMMSSLRSNFEVLLQLLKQTRILALGRGTAAAVYVLMVALAVPRWGLIGAAAATMLGYSLDVGLMGRFAFQRDRFPLPFDPAARAAIASAGMLLVVLLALQLPGIAGLLLSIAAGVVAYGLLMLLLGGLGRREFRFLLQALRTAGTEPQGAGE